MSMYYDTRREHGRIVVYLLQKSPPPEDIPYELRGYVSQEDWSNRLHKIKSTVFAFYKPLFERIWIICATFSIIIFPLIFNYILVDKIVQPPQSPHKRDDHRYESILEARAIGFGVFVGTLVFFLVPYLVWKMLGYRRMSRLLKEWAAQDEQRGSSQTGGYIPQWRVKHPSVFKSSAVLTITTPPNVPPSYFHPNAYLPSFVNPPPDDQGGYYYTYGTNQFGEPRVGPGGLPAYDGNIVGVHRFDDVKLPV